MALKNGGQYSGSVYCIKKEIKDLAAKASNYFLSTNMLFYDQHPRSRQLEMEVVSMVLKLYNGHEQCSGFTTSGGSTSILLAVLAHKRFFLSQRNIE